MYVSLQVEEKGVDALFIQSVSSNRKFYLPEFQGGCYKAYSVTNMGKSTKLERHRKCKHTAICNKTDRIKICKF